MSTPYPGSIDAKTARIKCKGCNKVKNYEDKVVTPYTCDGRYSDIRACATRDGWTKLNGSWFCGDCTNETSM